MDEVAECNVCRTHNFFLSEIFEETQKVSSSRFPSSAHFETRDDSHSHVSSPIVSPRFLLGPFGLSPRMEEGTARSPRPRERVLLECVLQAAVTDEAVGVERSQMLAFASHHDAAIASQAHATNTNASSSTSVGARDRLAFLIALHELETEQRDAADADALAYACF